MEQMNASARAEALEMRRRQVKAGMDRLVQTFNQRFHRGEWGQALGDPVRDFPRPLTIPKDHADATLYRRGAYIGMTLAALALTSTLITAGLPTFAAITIGTAVGFAMPMLVSAFILVSLRFRSTERSFNRICDIRPAFEVAVAVYGLSLAVMLLFPMTSGQWAVWVIRILPVFGMALWLVTMALIALAGILLAFADRLDWSYRDEREYRKLERECLQLSLLLSFPSETQAQGKEVGPVLAAMRDNPRETVLIFSTAVFFACVLSLVLTVTTGTAIINPAMALIGVAASATYWLMAFVQKFGNARGS